MSSVFMVSCKQNSFPTTILNENILLFFNFVKCKTNIFISLQVLEKIICVGTQGIRMAFFPTQHLLSPTAHISTLIV
jgi:hypothetical protein